MIEKKYFGRIEQGDVYKYILTDDETGGRVEIIEYGATVTSICVPNKIGTLTDVVLGFDDMEGYLACQDFFGATIGRCANRIDNATFTLNGKQYKLNANIPPHHLHGGFVGFDKKLWKSRIIDDKVRFFYFSPDGEEKYPGDLDVTVTFSFVNGKLTIEYQAVSTQDTLCNLTNHSYFNLNGHEDGSMLDNYLKIYADAITPTTDRQIPDGSFMSVKNTPFDFLDYKQIGKDINKKDIQLTYGLGFDHNYALNKAEKEFGIAAEAYSEKTGIHMSVYTTEPGIQFYAGGCLHDIDGKKGAHYTLRSAFCLETQKYPNACNCEAFATSVLRKGDVYSSTTVYSFDLK